jgi:hypothetical protein
MLEDKQKSSLKNLIQSPQWKIVEFVAEEYIKRINNGSSIRETDWETLREVVGREGKVQGVREFIQELYQLSQ